MNDQDNILYNKILRIIDDSPQKKITFADYMNLCLYDPEWGYYNSENIVIGEGGDFFTSASLSSDFGELLAVQIEELWRVLGKPKPFHLVEAGAGEGLLAVNIIQYLSNYYPDFFSCLEYIIIEKSLVLKDKQKQNIKENLGDFQQIKWSEWHEIENNSLLGCVFSNELIDAFPVHLIEFHEGVLKEVYLFNKDNVLAEVLGDLSTTEIKDYLEKLKINFNSNFYSNHYRTEVNLNGIYWLKTVANKLKQGYLLTIDYGYNAEKYYHPQRFKGTLKCYYQHRHHDNPYLNIGCQDITSHVNFTALEVYGDLYNLSKIGYIPQALFLMNLGLGDRISSLSSGKIGIGEIIERRNKLHNLINPQGLGNFGVLLQGKNLTPEQINYSFTGMKLK